MQMTLSRCSMPSILSYSPSTRWLFISLFDKAGYKISLTRDDFPLPLTPVTAVNTPMGNFALTFLRLFCFAPLTSMNLSPISLRLAGTGIDSLPVRYWPVMLSSQAIISSIEPCATILPPWTPAPGPISTI